MITVSVHEAKASFSRILEKAHTGEEIIVVKAGEPWARLVPLERRGRRIPGRYSEEIPPSSFEPLPDHEIKAWES